MTLLVKYCGGCNPRYDRGALVRRLQREYPAVTVVTSAQAGDTTPDLVAVVCGCSACCADHAALSGRYGKLLLSSDDDYAALRDAVARLLQKE